IAGLSNTPFNYVRDSELPTDALHIDRLFAKLERRVARNNEKFAEARQFSDDVLSDAVAEILLPGISAHVAEWQHGNRWLRGRDRVTAGTRHWPAPGGDSIDADGRR